LHRDATSSQPTILLVQLIKGWFQSVRPGSGYINLNVDVANTTVYEAGPLPHFLATRMDLSGVAALGKLKKKDLTQAKAEVMNKEVIAVPFCQCLMHSPPSCMSVLPGQLHHRCREQ